MLSSHRSSTNGFTLIELLVVLSIIGVLIFDLMPAAHRLRREATQLDQQSRLRSLGADLGSFADDAAKIRRDASALTRKVVEGGESGSLGATELQALCGDLLDTDNAAGLLLAQVGGALGVDRDRRLEPAVQSVTEDETGDRAALRRIRVTLTEEQTTLRQLETALSKVYACGPIVAAPPPESNVGQ